MNWLRVRYCGIWGFLIEAGEGLSHHPIIVKVTVFAHLVHRQSVVAANITRLHMFFVEMKAFSVSFQIPPIQGFALLTSEVAF